MAYANRSSGHVSTLNNGNRQEARQLTLRSRKTLAVDEESTTAVIIRSLARSQLATADAKQGSSHVTKAWGRVEGGGRLVEEVRERERETHTQSERKRARAREKERECVCV